MKQKSSHHPNVYKRWYDYRAVNIIIAVLAMIAVFIIINVAIIKNEQHLAHGQPVLLELAPVDPRGFMQGDYMALSYALEADVLNAIHPQANNVAENSTLQEDEFAPNLDVYQPSDGFVIVKTDTHNVGHFERLADSPSRDGLATNELPIYYRVRHGQVKLATNAFFFQEGHAKSFEAAKYGLFRVNENGKPLLTDMVDDKFKVIEGSANQVVGLED